MMAIFLKHDDMGDGRSITLCHKLLRTFHILLNFQNLV